MSADRKQKLEEIARYVLTSSAQMNADGFDKVLACCTDDIFLEWPFGPPPPLRGKAAIREFLLANTMDFEVTTEDVFVDAEKGVTVTTASSKGRNPRTGQPYTNRYVLLYKFRGDLIAEWYEYLNPIAVMEAAGG